MSIPLVFTYLSTIFIRFAFLVFLFSLFLYGNSAELLGGLYQTTLLPINSLIIMGDSSFIQETKEFDLLFTLVPIIVYSNAETDKLRILSENRDLAGIYMFTHLESRKRYIGSAFNLYERLRQYYSISRLSRNKTQYISNALLLYGHSAFSLSILEYIDITNLSKENTRKLILEREQNLINSLKPEYNVLLIAGSSLGFTHSEKSKALMKKIKSGENHPNFGKAHTVESKALMRIAKLGENHPFFGKTHTTETKALMSLNRSGENNAMYGRSHLTESKMKMSIAQGSAVFVYNSEGSLAYTFSSIRKAAEHFNCSPSTIKRYIITQQLFKDSWILLNTVKE